MTATSWRRIPTASVIKTSEAGDLLRLRAILTAAPGLRSRPRLLGLALAVLLLAQGEPDQALDLGRHVAELANAIQRRAHTIRLRGLRTKHPGLPGSTS